MEVKSASKVWQAAPVSDVFVAACIVYDWTKFVFNYLCNYRHFSPVWNFNALLFNSDQLFPTKGQDITFKWKQRSFDTIDRIVSEWASVSPLS